MLALCLKYMHHQPEPCVLACIYIVLRMNNKPFCEKYLNHFEYWNHILKHRIIEKILCKEKINLPTPSRTDILNQLFSRFGLSMKNAEMASFSVFYDKLIMICPEISKDIYLIVGMIKCLWEWQRLSPKITNALLRDAFFLKDLSRIQVNYKIVSHTFLNEFEKSPFYSLCASGTSNIRILSIIDIFTQCETKIHLLGSVQKTIRSCIPRSARIGEIRSGLKSRDTHKYRKRPKSRYDLLLERCILNGLSIYDMGNMTEKGLESCLHSS